MPPHAQMKEKKENKNLTITPKFFHEFWQRENELWETSMKESFRQRDERIKRLNKYKDEVNKLKTKIAQKRDERLRRKSNDI